MSTRAGRLGGALSLLALLALSAAGFASASSPPGSPVNGSSPGKITKVGQSNPTAPATAAGSTHAIGYRLAAKLTPSSTSSTAAGRWDGVLVHTIGTVKNGQMPSIPGCSVTSPKPGHPGQPGSPPRASGAPHQIKCGGAVPPFTVPAGSGQHWILGWRLTYSNLSSAVTSADIHVNVSAGSAPIAAANLCGAGCVSGKFGRTLLSDDQANAIIKGQGSVVVSTSKNTGGEISGDIVRVQQTATHK
jgi:hypothetical protein